MQNGKRLKKMEKGLLIAFLALAFVAIASPLAQMAFMPKYGRLVYTLDPVMAEFEGDYSSLGIHDRTKDMVSLLGREGASGLEVEIKSKLGYAFNGWDDGSLLRKRSDVFSKGTIKFHANCDYAVKEIPNINFKGEYGQDLSNVNVDISTGDLSVHTTAKSVSFPLDFENYQGQSKKNFFLINEGDDFFDGKAYKAYSLFYDKACLRQLFSIALYNALFDGEVSFKTASIYFNDEYCGLYVFVDYSSWLEPEPNYVVSCSNAEDAQDLNYSRRNYKFVFGSSATDENKQNLLSILEEINAGSYSSFDKESFIRRAVLNNFMNNSAQVENDTLISFKDGVMALSPVDSYSLSAGLFKYSNYHPDTELKYDSLTEKAIASMHWEDEIRERVKAGLEVFRDTAGEFRSWSSHLRNAISLNNEAYPVKPAFSMPAEIQSYNYGQHVSYFSNWLDARYEWLKSTY